MFPGLKIQFPTSLQQRIALELVMFILRRACYLLFYVGCAGCSKLCSRGIGDERVEAMERLIWRRRVKKEAAVNIFSIKRVRGKESPSLILSNLKNVLGISNTYA